MTDSSSGEGLETEAARALLGQAREARGNAYAPYSGFHVGAALLSEDGQVFTGANVENASYGLTTCAERTAVVKAMSEGIRAFRAIAVTGPDDEVGTPPCGSCRQILHEANPHLLVVTPGTAGEPRITPLTELLPGAFGGEQLSAHHGTRR
ncbi:cytidine deaminase [soil metagenome]